MSLLDANVYLLYNLKIRYRSFMKMSSKLKTRQLFARIQQDTKILFESDRYEEID